MKKRKKNKFKIKYILMILFIIYLASIFIRQEFEINKLEANIKDQKQKKTELKEYISENEKKAEYLNNISSAKNPVNYMNSLDNEKQKEEYKKILEHIENVAREELFMVKPNEIIYIDKNKLKNVFDETP
ncbi:FtsB family cell division protein [Senegalia massiliensis]|uniref:Septum formation initiator n=1 Tax=Senegalia massiliensis TaxID=1720316 RepID=A0A845R198_9CLOT|nr:hypothetical protein [Senegalia massiliensis]NBI07496.1 hypothetical protein [Senegalia massiliensis]